MLLINIFTLTKITDSFWGQLLCGEEKKKMTSLKDTVNVWKWPGEVQPDVLHPALTFLKLPGGATRVPREMLSTEGTKK